jgi:hypothetical protein
LCDDAAAGVAGLTLQSQAIVTADGSAVAAEVKPGEPMCYYVERRERADRNFVFSDKLMSNDEWQAKYCVPNAGVRIPVKADTVYV